MIRRRAIFRPTIKPKLLLSVIAASVGIATILGWFGTAARGSSVSGPRILLISKSDSSTPLLEETIGRLERSGFTVTDDVQTALSLSASPEAIAFLVTREKFGAVPTSLWASLYSRHVIVGGLDVSLHELQPLALPGSVAGQARLRYTPNRAIFSFVYSTGDCGRGAMSDWLDNWNLSGLLQQRALEIANSTRPNVPGLDCPADRFTGGNP